MRVSTDEEEGRLDETRLYAKYFRDIKDLVYREFISYEMKASVSVVPEMVVQFS
jgi:hypothetical protein